MYKIKPWNQLIMGLLIIVNISCNLFLYRFLGNITEKSTAKSEVDKKRTESKTLFRLILGLLYLVFVSLPHASFFSLTCMGCDNICSILRDDVLLYINWSLVNLGYI